MFSLHMLRAHVRVQPAYFMYVLMYVSKMHMLLTLLMNVFSLFLIVKIYNNLIFLEFIHGNQMQQEG